MKTQLAAGLAPREINNKVLLDHPTMPLKERDMHNLKAKIYREGLGEKTPI